MVGFRSDPEIFKKNEELKRQTLFKLYDLFDGSFTYSEIEDMDAERLDDLINARVAYDKKAATKREERNFAKQFGIKKK